MLEIVPPRVGPPNAVFTLKDWQCIPVATHLHKNSASFYMEPQPFDVWLLVVGHEHRSTVDTVLDELVNHTWSQP